MIQTIWLHMVRCYLQIGLFFYYKKIIVVNKSCVPKKGAVLFLSNHHNALIDALLIATMSGRFSYFLTRASVFSKPSIEKLLKSLQMLPVYRVRDGWSTISNNGAIFSKCVDLLHLNKAVALFPEGNHSLQRTVRNLSKGFTRIVFETMETYPDTNLQIVPIGLNYRRADAFGDSAAIYFGNAISANDYFLSDKAKAVALLKTDIQERISKLTTHIPADAYSEILFKLQEKQVDFLNPDAVNACVASNFETCEQQKEPVLIGMKKLFKFLMITLLFGPYLIWKYAAYPKIQEVEFVATFRFAIAITLVPVWLVLIACLLTVFFSGYIGIVFVMVSLLVSLLAVKV